MGKVVKAIIVTKPEDLPKVELGQTSIILRPNLNIKAVSYTHLTLPTNREV